MLTGRNSKAQDTDDAGANPLSCDSAGVGPASASSSCTRNGAGGIFASGGIFLGARYLNVNGTIQSGQPDYAVTLTNASVGSTISAWETQWTANRGTYLARGRSSLVQVAGRLPTDNEASLLLRSTKCRPGTLISMGGALANAWKLRLAGAPFSPGRMAM